MARSHALAGATVLVVEDDADLRRVMALMLQDAGASPVEAGDGQQALRLAREAVPAVVLLDLGLPDVDGLELLRTLCRTGPAAVIVVTGRARPSDRWAGLAGGAVDYLVKPFGAAELTARVGEVLRRSGPG